MITWKNTKLIAIPDDNDCIVISVFDAKTEEFKGNLYIQMDFDHVGGNQTGHVNYVANKQS